MWTRTPSICVEPEHIWRKVRVLGRRVYRGCHRTSARRRSSRALSSSRQGAQVGPHHTAAALSPAFDVATPKSPPEGTALLRKIAGQRANFYEGTCAQRRTSHGRSWRPRGEWLEGRILSEAAPYLNLN